MKWQIQYWLITVFFVYSCNSEPERNTTSTSIEGVYIRESKGEFHLVSDTLLLRLIDPTRDLIFIDHRMGYQRLTNNLPGKREWKEEKLIGIWEVKSGQLKEQKHGRIYLLSSDGKRLIFGTIVYQKVS